VSKNSNDNKNSHFFFFFGVIGIVWITPYFGVLHIYSVYREISLVINFVTFIGKLKKLLISEADIFFIVKQKNYQYLASFTEYICKFFEILIFTSNTLLMN